jgi:hypothetical protein
MTIECEFCGKGPADGTSVFRVNRKGEKGIWRCRPHLDKQPDPETSRVVEILEKGNSE